MIARFHPFLHLLTQLLNRKYVILKNSRFTLTVVKSYAILGLVR